MMCIKDTVRSILGIRERRPFVYIQESVVNDKQHITICSTNDSNSKIIIVFDGLSRLVESSDVILIDNIAIGFV